MVSKVLCVAEKPAIAKAVAQHLAGGHVNTREVRGNRYVKNYEFDFAFPPPWGQCSVTMTSVLGHLTAVDFSPEYRKWQSCEPAQLFDAPIVKYVDKDKQAIADNIKNQARYSQALFIWTDCDREGEHIGSEVRQCALEGNQRLEIKRARFSNTERAHVLDAARRPMILDENQINAVSGRIELDLRLGASFTRFQTLTLQKMGGGLADLVLSYGSCQFPTLGFVVDRYFRVQRFVPEKFWTIRVTHTRDRKEVIFTWQRHRLFDRAATTIIYERCLTARGAKITKLQKHETSRWPPLPLTTVELQRLGSTFLHMDSQQVMKIAEELYTKGFISYPRTETDQFDKGIDLKRLVEKQTQDGSWGTYARGLMDGGFSQPRNGRNNDQAHPPIHPVTYVARNALNADQHRVYEFVTRRFLACCSKSAKGEQTTIELEYGEETFYTNGLNVIERNYLEVYPYQRWESSQELPTFTLHETFEPAKAMIVDGETCAPGYLTEPDLISLMDANGIGTDATMAEHIAKVKERQYVRVQARGSGSGRSSDSLQMFIPTTLGVALIEGYDSIGLDTSLGKPFLRKEMEMKMTDICAGRKSRNDFVHETLDQYREAFAKTQQQVEVLKAACQKYVFQAPPAARGTTS